MLKKFSKKQIILTGVIGIALTIVVTILIGLNVPEYSSASIEETIEVKEGECTSSGESFDFSITKAGKYIINLDWWQDNKPGFVTGAYVNDANGKEVCCVTGNMGTWDMVPMELEAGNYKVNLSFITKEDEYYSFLNAHNFDEIVNFGFKPTDGSYDMTYTVSVRPVNNWPKLLGIMCGLIVGLFIAMIVVVVTKNGEDLELKYDERQMLARGKAFKAGFITILIYIGVGMLMEISEVSLPVDKLMELAVGGLLGICVFLGVAIWENAYYALNENGRKITIAFTIIGLANIILGILSIIGGELFVDGVLQGFRCINLLCGLIFVYIAVVTGLRVRADKKEAAFEEDEDDEEPATEESAED